MLQNRDFRNEEKASFFKIVHAKPDINFKMKVFYLTYLIKSNIDTKFRQAYLQKRNPPGLLMVQAIHWPKKP